MTEYFDSYIWKCYILNNRTFEEDLSIWSWKSQLGLSSHCLKLNAWFSSERSIKIWVNLPLEWDATFLASQLQGEVSTFWLQFFWHVGYEGLELGLGLKPKTTQLCSPPNTLQIGTKWDLESCRKICRCHLSIFFKMRTYIWLVHGQARNENKHHKNTCFQWDLTTLSSLITLRRIFAFNLKLTQL